MKFECHASLWHINLYFSVVGPLMKKSNGLRGKNI